MLRVALLSLLLGLVSALGIVALLFSPAEQAAGKRAALTWQIGQSNMVAGVATQTGGTTTLALNDQGVAWINLPLQPRAAEGYRYLHLALDRFPPDLQTTLVWQHPDTGETHSELLETLPRESLWIHLGESQAWRAPIEALSIIFNATPGAQVSIAALSLRQPSRKMQLLALYNDWTSGAPWRNASINSYSGVTQYSPMYPAPFAALVLALSLLAFMALHVWRNGWSTPDWRALGLVCLLCWLGIDLLWQVKLNQQLAETYRQFAGKSTEEKLAVGPDAELYRFVRDARKLIEPDTARVFVSSRNDYRGLRSAYYLYPFNVYWELRGDELPPPAKLHSGDYVVIVPPSDLRVRENRNRINTGRGLIAADLLINDQGKKLLRVQ